MHEYFGLSPVDLERMQATYRSLHRQQKYAERFGERKALSFEEAFLLCVHLSLTQPAVVVHIGAGEGQALRRIVDLQTLLEQSFPIVCHDLVDMKWSGGQATCAAASAQRSRNDIPAD